jgi:hypothetical protein
MHPKGLKHRSRNAVLQPHMCALDPGCVRGPLADLRNDGCNVHVGTGGVWSRIESSKDEIVCCRSPHADHVRIVDSNSDGCT